MQDFRSSKTLFIFSSELTLTKNGGDNQHLAFSLWRLASGSGPCIGATTSSHQPWSRKSHLWAKRFGYSSGPQLRLSDLGTSSGHGVCNVSLHPRGNGRFTEVKIQASSCASFKYFYQELGVNHLLRDKGLLYTHLYVSRGRKMQVDSACLISTALLPPLNFSRGGVEAENCWQSSLEACTSRYKAEM